MTLLYAAFHEAFLNNLNLSLCSAILNVNCLYAFIASLCLFKENITCLQVLGTIINLSGVLIVTFNSRTAENEASPKMLIYSFIAATLMGIRIIISWYCTSKLDAFIYITLNFVSDFIYGIILTILCLFWLINIHVDYESDGVYFLAAFILCLADIFLFIAISWGFAGPVVSIVSSNGIVVGIFHLIIFGVLPTLIQLVGILGSFVGVTLLSSGDMIY